MSDKTCDDCWYCKDFDGIALDEHARTCTLSGLGTGAHSYDKACDKFVIREEGLERFMERYRTVQKTNSDK